MFGNKNQNFKRIQIAKGVLLVVLFVQPRNCWYIWPTFSLQSKEDYIILNKVNSHISFNQMWILKYCKDLLCCCNSLFYSRKFHLFKKLTSSVYKPFVSKQYDCSPPLTADKMLVIFINNSDVEQVEAPAIYLSLYGFLWSFGFQYKLGKSQYSSLNRIFINDINDLCLDKTSPLS